MKNPVQEDDVNYGKKPKKKRCFAIEHKFIAFTCEKKWRVWKRYTTVARRDEALRVLQLKHANSDYIKFRKQV